MINARNFVATFIIDGYPWASRTLMSLPNIGDEITFPDKDTPPIEFVVERLCWILNFEDEFYLPVKVYLTEKDVSP